MKEFRQAIPEGMQARVENGEVVYTPIEKCEFEIGDLVCFDGLLRIIEGISGGFVESSRSVSDGVFKNEMHGLCGFVSEYTKATPEQEKLFNQKCLENGFWFDRENKKWIELEEGEVYYMSFNNCVNCTIIFKEIYNDCICDHSYYNEESVCKLTISENPTGYINAVINISEATEEEKQKLFDALKEKRKQWNAEKRCVEDLKWKPELEEDYWFIDSFYNKKKTTNELFYGDIERVLIGNCFKTEAECEKYAQYMRECSLNYKPE